MLYIVLNESIQFYRLGFLFIFTSKKTTLKQGLHEVSFAIEGYY